jgi:hypothetical protein
MSDETGAMLERLTARTVAAQSKPCYAVVCNDAGDILVAKRFPDSLSAMIWDWTDEYPDAEFAEFVDCLADSLYLRPCRYHDAV